MDDFAPRSAALEYWFWKFHSGDLAFLVDFIVRRRTGDAEVRVSLWVRGLGRVVHQRDDDWSTDAGRVAIGGSQLQAQGSTGVAGDISWDLRWTGGADLVEPWPRVMARVQPLDMQFLLRPSARFSGSVRVGSATFAVDDVPGLLTHYWGRQLSEHWLWISATSFEDDPRRRLEVLIARSRLWGRIPLPMPTAYAWTTDGGRPELTISPLTGIVRLRRMGTDAVVDVRRLDGRRHRIVCRVGAVPVNDLGDGIRQTILGDLTLDEQRAVAETIGIESRGWPL
jgi:hypothetical protein